MPRTKESVEKQIRDAFRGVALGAGIGLFEAQGLDDYAGEAACRAYRDKDEKYDWEKLTVTDLERCSSSLSFFDAEGMRFHLPAFLIAELHGHLGVTRFHLTHAPHYGGSEFTTLSDDQKTAVREFLLLIRDDPNCEFERPDIERALAGFWKE